MDTVAAEEYLPKDDVQRSLALILPADDEHLIHLGIVGDTYTILLAGAQTAQRFCLIDMHIPPGGGPGPHRHDFEETFLIVDGEVELTFRGERTVARTGQTINIPANAPHMFHNTSGKPARALCICSPAGNERFFQEIGVPVAGRTTQPSPLTPEEQKDFMEKAAALAPKYRTELLQHA